MLKKILYLILIITIVSSNIYAILGNDIDEELTQEEFIEVVNQSNDEPILNSRIAVAYDRKSGNVIWGKNEHKKSAMASTTKIMTAILVIENCNLNETIIVSR